MTGGRTASFFNALAECSGLRSWLAITSAVAAAGGCHAETLLSADVSVRGQIASNPYLLPGSDTSSASVSASVAPAVTYSDGTGTFKLGGDVHHTEFARHYRPSDDFSSNARLTKRVSSKLSLFADLGFDSSVTTANNLLTVPSVSTPASGPAPLTPDAAVLTALQQRRVSYNGDAGFDYQPTFRDTWHIRSGFALTRYGAAARTPDFNYVSSSIGYDRIVDGRTSAGFSAALARVDYVGVSVGDAVTVSPQFTFSTQLDPHWSLSGAAGATFSSIQAPFGKAKQTSFSGSVNICRLFQRSKLCLTGSRSVQPSLLGGVVPQSSVSVSFSLPLDGRSDISATADYTSSARLITSGASQPVDYGRAKMTYSRRITERFSAFIGGAFANTTSSGVAAKNNVELNFGITRTFGDRR